MLNKIDFIFVTQIVLIQYGGAQFQGDLVRTVSGCNCKDSYILQGQQYSGCINPSWARAESPWCEVEESCRTFHSSFMINERPVLVDFCDRGVVLESSLIDPTTTSATQYSLADTVFGCKCAERWTYKGYLYSGCGNPDSDIFGDWCQVDEKSCQVYFLGVISRSFSFIPVVAYDYCRNGEYPNYDSYVGYDDYCYQQPATPSPSGCPPPTPDLTDPTLQPSAPSPLTIQIPPSSSITIPSQSLDQGIQRDEPSTDCRSVLTVLNETDNLLSFNDIILEGGLEGTLVDLQEFTLFAPNNNAVAQFADAQNIDVSDFFLFKSNIAALKRVVQLHVVNQLVSEDVLQASDGEKFSTQLGQDVEIIADGSEVLVVPPTEGGGEQSTVLFKDGVVEVCQGLLYTVDTVLVPAIES